MNKLKIQIKDIRINSDEAFDYMRERLEKALINSSMIIELLDYELEGNNTMLEIRTNHYNAQEVYKYMINFINIRKHHILNKCLKRLEADNDTHLREGNTIRSIIIKNSLQQIKYEKGKYKCLGLLDLTMAKMVDSAIDFIKCIDVGFIKLCVNNNDMLYKCYKECYKIINEQFYPSNSIFKDNKDESYYYDMTKLLCNKLKLRDLAAIKNIEKIHLYDCYKHSEYEFK